MPRLSNVLLSSLVVASALLNSHVAQAALVTVTNAATGAPLADAVVEVNVADGAQPDTPSSVEVFQRNAAFHPHVSAVPVGTSVTFPNRDTSRHHVYSFSSTGVFDLNLYRQDTPPPVHFNKAGVAVIGCNIHDDMQAFIVISNAEYRGVTDKNGKVNLEQLPPGEHRLRVWHPRLEASHQRWWDVPDPISADDQRTVSLTLTVPPKPASQPSSLQQRFNRAMSE